MNTAQDPKQPMAQCGEIPVRDMGEFESGTPFWAPAWLLAWPRPQDGLGRGGRFGSKNNEKVKVLRMEFSIVGTQGPNSILVETIKKLQIGL